MGDWVSKAAFTVYVPVFQVWSFFEQIIQIDSLLCLLLEEWLQLCFGRSHCDLIKLGFFQIALYRVWRQNLLLLALQELWSRHVSFKITEWPLRKYLDFSLQLWLKWLLVWIFFNPITDEVSKLRILYFLNLLDISGKLLVGNLLDDLLLFHVVERDGLRVG